MTRTARKDPQEVLAIVSFAHQDLAMQITQAPIFVLYVRDPERSRAFYESALGLKPTLVADGYCELECGSAVLGLINEGAAKILAGAPAGHGLRAELYLRLDDVDEAVRRLVKAGARCTSPISDRDWGDRAAYFEDPDGHLVAVARKII